MSYVKGKGIFIDRDGVLNYPIKNPNTGLWDSPLEIEDFKLYDGVVESCKKLQDAGFSLFLVSNQPSYAKGKITLETREGIHNKLVSTMEKGGVFFKQYYYCHHSVDSIYHEEKYMGPCDCRKPSPYNINRSIWSYHLDKEKSWMIGDFDTDIECGQNADVRTILIKTPESKHRQDTGVIPDISCSDFNSSVRAILEKEE